MEEIIALQAIIGTDKKNPVLSLLREKNTSRYQVYYGCHILEVIQDDPDHIGYRSAIGRLYNARLKRKILSQVFGHDRRTMQLWGKALINKDSDEALRILSGQRNRKITKEIQSFARSRFFLIYKENRYNYSQQIRKEIEDIFGKSLSAELLRPYFNQWKKELSDGLNNKLQPSPVVATVATPEIPDDSEEPKGQSPCDCPQDANGVIPFNSSFYTNNSESDNRKEDASIVSKLQFVYHSGIVLFAKYFKQLEEMFATDGSIIKQWFAMILLEAVNIEQSKYLHFTSLTQIIGLTVRRAYEQRQELNHIANQTNCFKIFGLNAQLCECKEMTDFYYDPHSKHYTGMANILKGWCSAIGHADKVLHSDFIHSITGQPLFFKHFDNYDDLRQRYKLVVEEFRSCCGIDITQRITLIIDRGIFSFDIFQAIVDDVTLELITWEKNFKPSPEPWLKYECHHFTMRRYRNNSHDEQIYTFQYVDMLWEKDTRIRRIVVKATNPRGKTVELGIIATDKNREATMSALIHEKSILLIL